MPILAVVVSVLCTMFGAGTDPECFALGGLDVARAEALADVDLSALTSLYDSDAAAAADRRILTSYAAHGFRIAGAGVVRDACHVVVRSPDRVELAVTDRLARSWAVSESGRWRRLPRGGPTERRVVLHGRPGAWVIGSVVDAGGHG